MSWSRTYGPGIFTHLIALALEDAPAVKATIPDFEHEQVDAARAAAEAVGPTIPADSVVSLSLSGHGWRNTVTGEGAGNVAVNVAYSIPAAVSQADGTASTGADAPASD